MSHQHKHGDCRRDLAAVVNDQERPAQFVLPVELAGLVIKLLRPIGHDLPVLSGPVDLDAHPTCPESRDEQPAGGIIQVVCSVVLMGLEMVVVNIEITDPQGVCSLAEGVVDVHFVSDRLRLNPCPASQAQSAKQSCEGDVADDAPKGNLREQQVDARGSESGGGLRDIDGGHGE